MILQPLAPASLVAAYIYAYPDTLESFQAVGLNSSHMPTEALSSLMVELEKGTLPSDIPKALGATWGKLGGLEWISKAADDPCFNFGAASEAARVVIEAAKVGKLSRALSTASKNLGADIPQEEILSNLEAAISEARGTEVQVATSLKDLVPAYLDSLMEERTPIRITCVVPEITDMFGNLYGGEMVIIGARPACGKTSLLTQLLIGSARAGSPCLLLTGEMSQSEIVGRMLAQVSGVNAGVVRSGKFLTPTDSERIMDEGQRLSEEPIFIEELRGRNIEQLGGLIKRQVKKHGVKIVGVDYLGLIETKGKRSRYEEVSDLSRKLKTIAMENKIVLLCLVQLNRSGAGQENKPPELSHFRDSGQIEQDADLALLLSRIEGVNGATRFDLAKNRHGPTKVEGIAFSGAQCLFTHAIDLDRVPSPSPKKTTIW